MEKELIQSLQKSFEECSYIVNGIEFWYARDLQKWLGYIEWRKFLGVIEKAKAACQNSNNEILDHFVGAAKTINMPKGASKEIEDYKKDELKGEASITKEHVRNNADVRRLLAIRGINRRNYLLRKMLKN